MNGSSKDEVREGATAGSTPEDDVRMTIWEHLSELRSRVVRAALGLMAGALVCWNFRVTLLDWLVRPYAAVWKTHFPTIPLELQTLAPGDVIVNYMELAFVGGIVLGAPIIFYQLWAFISPGLYAKEKKYIIPFVLFSTTLFTSGVAFANFAFFPFFYNYTFSQLGTIGASGTALTSRPTMEYYVDFTTRMMLLFGGIFELPLFITFLAMAGIVTSNQLVKFGRWAILLSFIIGAIVTPGPEVMSQLIVSTALIALYGLSVAMAFVFGRKPRAAEPT